MRSKKPRSRRRRSEVATSVRAKIAFLGGLRFEATADAGPTSGLEQSGSGCEVLTTNSTGWLDHEALSELSGDRTPPGYHLGRLEGPGAPPGGAAVGGARGLRCGRVVARPRR